MHSYFLAETLKYLWLLFAEEDPMSFDKWMFNTYVQAFYQTPSLVPDHFSLCVGRHIRYQFSTGQNERN